MCDDLHAASSAVLSYSKKHTLLRWEWCGKVMYKSILILSFFIPSIPIWSSQEKHNEIAVCSVSSPNNKRIRQALLRAFTLKIIVFISAFCIYSQSFFILKCKWVINCKNSPLIWICFRPVSPCRTFYYSCHAGYLSNF